jgi:small subunit ribosomal protein S2
MNNGSGTIQFKSDFPYGPVRKKPVFGAAKRTKRRWRLAMATVGVKDLLEAGVHFGHQVKRWNPKMKPFVYGVKNGIYIIDLAKTMRQIADACNFLQHVVAEGGQVLFVGTKRQAQQVVREAAEKTGMFFVAERWLGGTLTNNVTIQKSVKKMMEIDGILDSSEATSMKKKELSSFRRQALRLHRNLDGIREMKKLPAVLVVIDVCHEDIAIREAKKLGIPVVALVDTNGNPEDVDYPIPANDDAVRSIQLILDVCSDAIRISAEIYGKRYAEEKAARDAAMAEEQERKERDRKERKEKADKESDKKRRSAAPARRRPAATAAPKAKEAGEEAPKAAAGDASETATGEKKKPVVRKRPAKSPEKTDAKDDSPDSSPVKPAKKSAKDAEPAAVEAEG